MLPSMDSPILPQDEARPEIRSPAAPTSDVLSAIPGDDLAGQNPLKLSPPPLRPLTADDLGMPPRRRLLPLVLFLATCFFTYAAGANNWQPAFFGQQLDRRLEPYWNWPTTINNLKENWQQGLLYMGCVMAVLLAHEMGHFLMTVRYKVPASYPIFIPMPMMFIGTMGAVIGMQSHRANRRQMFDIGIAGPLAGLLLAVPLVVIGILIAPVGTPKGPGEEIGDPLLLKILVPLLRHDIPQGSEIVLNAFLMAGWVGIFITGLNMLPVSQLDGGHVSYGLFLRNSYVLGRVFFIAAIAFVILSKQYGWTMMLLLVMAIGVEHPPTFDDRVRLGPARTIIGLLSLAIPVLCFTPYPLYLG